MSAREQIFATIRRSLGRDELPATVVAELEARVARHAPNLIPQRSRVQGDDLLALFCRKADEVGTTSVQLTSLDAVPGAVSAYLRDNDLPRQIRMAPDPALAQIPWGAQSHLEITYGRGEMTTLVGLTACFAGVAETGTLVFLSGEERPATLNFLPDTHIVVLHAADVVGAYEDALAKLRDVRGDAGFMPRTVNFVTGPSRTADIALQIVRGAHGPRRLHVMLIGHIPKA